VFDSLVFEPPETENFRPELLMKNLTLIYATPKLEHFYRQLLVPCLL